MCGGGGYTHAHTHTHEREKNTKAKIQLQNGAHGWEEVKQNFSINQGMFDSFIALSGASFGIEA